MLKPQKGHVVVLPTNYNWVECAPFPDLEAQDAETIQKTRLSLVLQAQIKQWFYRTEKPMLRNLPKQSNTTRPSNQRIQAHTPKKKTPIPCHSVYVHYSVRSKCIC